MINNNLNTSETSDKEQTNHINRQEIEHPTISNTEKELLIDANLLLVKLLTPTAICPSRMSLLSIGYDLYSDEDVEINPTMRVPISTGVAVSIPIGCYGRIAPRSSLSRLGIDVCAGVIDPDYRGDVKVLLHNTGEEKFTIRQGDRIAQMIPERAMTPDVLLVDELDETDRGQRGFGSTGK